ncbi:junctional adhesion molecule 2A isoform X1 [Ictalurus punctatus]|uniref:Junctional adhesion molecule 2A isoform X1 n=1 Tax=Ictalurus punctatus TaxID=7998 RepID=A0A2D0Q5M5_ICTPU|nr:junctional adhesion molecule 2A isoform X1 [Ictalurus punctatus]
MKIAVFLPVLLPLLLQSVPVTPVTVSTSSRIVKVEEHSEAKLSCEFKTEKDQNPRIEWKKMEEKGTSFVYFNGSFAEFYMGRAKMEGATITLQKVTLKDDGEYRCEVSAAADDVQLGETILTLNVLVPPHIPSCEIPSSALTGSRVALRCRDKYSIPPANYTWYKDKTPVFPPRHTNATYSVNKETGILTFHAVTIADSGLYHCEANNRVGKPKSCVGNHMTVDDLNVPGIVAGIVIFCLIITLCTLGVCYAHRQGYFNRHRGRSFWIQQCHGVAHISSQNLNRSEDIPHAGYGPPSQNIQDFKHTQSFML